MKENCTRNEEMNVTNISEENDDASSKRQRTEWSMNCIFYLTRKIEDQFCSLWKVFSSFISIFIVWQRCSCNFISIPVTHRTSVNAISKGFEEIVSIIYRNWLRGEPTVLHINLLPLKTLHMLFLVIYFIFLFVRELLVTAFIFFFSIPATQYVFKYLNKYLHNKIMRLRIILYLFKTIKLYNNIVF